MLAGALLFAAALANAQTEKGFDYYAWERVLQKHVKRGALVGVSTSTVAYDKVKKDPDFWEAVESLKNVDLDNISLNESFAIGCNAYNIYSMKALIDNPCTYKDGKCKGPVNGLMGIKNGFTAQDYQIGNKNFSLNELELSLRTPAAPIFRKDLLPVKEDLRVHGCLVCDGISCPDVQMYHPDTIEADLTSVATNWMHNPYKGMRIDTANNTVFLSRIMAWFHEDFDAQGGVMEAYKPYFPAEATEWIAANPDYNIDYIGYVWDANGPVPCPCDNYKVTDPEVQKQPAAFVSYFIPKTTMNTREDVINSMDDIPPMWRGF